MTDNLNSMEISLCAFDSSTITLEAFTDQVYCQLNVRIPM